MEIAKVADIIHQIADGIVDDCQQTLVNNADAALLAVHEQLMSGIDADGQYLSPNYDNDPYFDEEGYWKGRAKDYKAWKYAITPPSSGVLIGLPPRPDNVPNLFIDGTFHGSIVTQPIDGGIRIFTRREKSKEIVDKYGDQILGFSVSAIEYYNAEIMMPSIERFFAKCGYR